MILLVLMNLLLIKVVSLFIASVLIFLTNLMLENCLLLCVISEIFSRLDTL